MKISEWFLLPFWLVAGLVLGAIFENIPQQMTTQTLLTVDFWGWLFLWPVYLVAYALIALVIGVITLLSGVGRPFAQDYRLSTEMLFHLFTTLLAVSLVMGVVALISVVINWIIKTVIKV